MKKYIKPTLLNLLVFVALLVAVSSCGLSEEDNDASIGEVNFGFDKTHIYTYDTIVISMDVFTIDTVSLEIYVGDVKAELLSSYSNLRVKVPFIEEEYTSLTVRNESEMTVISDRLKVYPGTVNFELLGETPFKGRTYMSNFKTDNADYLYGGDESWKFDVLSNQWEKVEVIEGLVPNQLGVNDVIFFYNGSTYQVRIRLLDTDKYWFIVNKLNSETNTWNIEYDSLFEESIWWFASVLRRDNKLYLLLDGSDIYVYDINNHAMEKMFEITEKWGGDFTFLFTNEDMIYLYEQPYSRGTPRFKVIQYNIIEDEYRPFGMYEYPLDSENSTNYNIGYNGYSVLFDGARDSGSSSSYYKVTPK